MTYSIRKHPTWNALSDNIPEVEGSVHWGIVICAHSTLKWRGTGSGWFFRGVSCVDTRKRGPGLSPSLCRLRTCFMKGDQILLNLFAVWHAFIVTTFPKCGNSRRDTGDLSRGIQIILREISLNLCRPCESPSSTAETHQSRWLDSCLRWPRPHATAFRHLGLHLCGASFAWFRISLLIPLTCMLYLCFLIDTNWYPSSTPVYIQLLEKLINTNIHVRDA